MAVSEWTRSKEECLAQCPPTDAEKSFASAEICCDQAVAGCIKIKMHLHSLTYIILYYMLNHTSIY